MALHPENRYVAAFGTLLLAVAAVALGFGELGRATREDAGAGERTTVG